MSEFITELSNQYYFEPAYLADIIIGVALSIVTFLAGPHRTPIAPANKDWLSLLASLNPILIGINGECPPVLSTSPTVIYVELFYTDGTIATFSFDQKWSTLSIDEHYHLANLLAIDFNLTPEPSIKSVFSFSSRVVGV